MRHRRAGALRQRRRLRVKSRGTAAAGVGLVMAVVLGLAGYLLMARTDHQLLAPSTSADIAQAMVTVPARDVEGTDLPGLPRPPGSTRSFSQQSGSVTTIIYDSRNSPTTTWTLTRDSLQRSGWQIVGTDETMPAEGDLRLFGRNEELVQVRWFSGDELVAVSYVVRTKQ